MKRSSIFFHYLYPFHFPERTKTKDYINDLVFEEGFKLERLDFIFCSDAYLLNINQQFLQHDTFTDIITFDNSTNLSLTKGEIYISIERVQENGKAYNVAFLHELHRVLFHGVLHLCGYADSTQLEKESMRRKEDYYLQKFKISRETR